MSDSDRYDDDAMEDYDGDEETVAEYDTEEGQLERNPAEHGKWVSLAIAVLGAWLIVEPFLIEVVAGNFWNDVVVGAALVLIGGYNYYRRADERLASVGAAAFAALLGLWMIVSPWAWGVEIGGTNVVSQLGFWNDVVVGALVLILGAYSAYEARDTDVGAVVAE